MSSPDTEPVQKGVADALRREPVIGMLLVAVIIITLIGQWTAHEANQHRAQARQFRDQHLLELLQDCVTAADHHSRRARKFDPDRVPPEDL